MIECCNFRPHIANFASEASPGIMAGLVPQKSSVNGTIEVKGFFSINGTIEKLFFSSINGTIEKLFFSSIIEVKSCFFLN